jgi:hypothetical protein
MDNIGVYLVLFYLFLLSDTLRHWPITLEPVNVGPSYLVNVPIVLKNRSNSK